MFGDGSLTLREFLMREPLPLASIQEAVLEFLRGHEDAALFGAQAVNAYVDEPRMTQDIDILSIHAEKVAEDIRAHLGQRFQIAVRVRSVQNGLGFRLYQIQKPKNRHLVDVRSIPKMPTTQRIGDILVLAPAELICSKVISMVSRPKTAKGLTDAADLRRLLLTFPELKTQEGPVAERLRSSESPQPALAAWRDLVDQEILAEDEEAGY